MARSNDRSRTLEARTIRSRDWDVTTESPRLQIIDERWEHLRLEIDGGPRAVVMQGCDTCEYLFGFEGPEGLPARTLAPESIAERLNGDNWLIDDDSLLEAIAAIVPPLHYIVIEMVIRPLRVEPGSADDYFAVEGPDLFGVHRYMNDDDEWVDSPSGRPGLPLWRERGATRVPVLELRGQQVASTDAGLFHHLHPLTSPVAPDEDRIAWYEARMTEGHLPCALGLSFLDVRSPAVGGGPGLLPWDEHWLLSTYLLDGHHKVEAAARTGSPVRLLSFVRTYRGNASTLLAALEGMSEASGPPLIEPGPIIGCTLTEPPPPARPRVSPRVTFAFFFILGALITAMAIVAAGNR